MVFHSLQRNVRTAKSLTDQCPYGQVSLRWIVLTAKCSYGEASSRRNFLTARTVNCPMAKCPTAKSPTAKSPGTDVEPSYSTFIKFFVLLGVPQLLRMFQKDGLCQESNAFLKSMKLTMVWLRHSTGCLMKFLNTNILWSTHDLPLLNPACPSFILSSSDLYLRFNIIIAKTLQGTESRVMSLQLVQSERFPFSLT